MQVNRGTLKNLMNCNVNSFVIAIVIVLSVQIQYVHM